MFRLFVALNILFINLYACKGGFESCKLKVKHSSSIKNNTLQIPVLKNKRLVFSKNKPSQKIIKYDPFLSLYLVEDKKSFKHPFTINMHLSLGSAAVNNKRAVEGKITKHQVGLNKLAGFSEPIFSPAVLTNSCCSLEGIVTNHGIIEKEYLQYFLNLKNNAYSDIGVRVKNEKKNVIVKSINPFIKNQQFKKDDCILELDGKKIKKASSLMKKILFSKLNTKHKVKIKRDNKTMILKITTHKRYGGGYISDTFLEQKGIFFDKDLKITKIKSGYKSYGFKLGDQLLKVNDSFVDSYVQVRKNISNFDEKASLLFQRDGFQFFVSIK